MPGRDRPRTIRKRIPLLRPRVETTVSWSDPDGAPSASDRSLSLPNLQAAPKIIPGLSWAVEAPEPKRNPTLRRTAKIRLDGGLHQGLK